MSVALRPFSVKFLLLAAGVLLGLLAIALLLLPGDNSAQAEFVNNVNNSFQHSEHTQILAGVLWH